MKIALIGGVAVLAFAACGGDDPTESGEYQELSGRLSSAEQVRDDVTQVADELDQRNSELVDEVDDLTAEVDEVTEELDQTESERDEVSKELNKTRRQRNRAQAEAQRLREEYDPQIRAALQAELDAAVAEACQAAIDDIDAPIDELISYDESWGPIADEDEMIELVRGCSEEERAKTREQREADRLADCQPVDPDELEKDPEAHEGVCVVIHARIVQFDAATGRCSFHANIATDYSERSYDYDIRSMFGYHEDEVTSMLETDCPALDGIDGDDHVQIWATGVGHYTYDTTIGGSTTVPSFKIEKIDLLLKD